MIEIRHLLDAVTCHDSDSVLIVSRILRDTQTRHAVVIDEHKKPIGIVSAVDITNRVVAAGKDAAKTFARDIMTSPIATMDINASYDDAYRAMVNAGIYAIPVTKQGALIGLLDFNCLFGKCKELSHEKHS